MLLTLSAPKQKILKKEDDYLLPQAIKWLRGQEINGKDAEITKLPVQDFTKKNGESQSFNKALQLIRIIADYTSLVICFDELESLKTTEAAFTVSEIMPDFIKTVHNNLDTFISKNAILLLSLWLPDTWEYKVEKSKERSIQDRLCSLSSLQKQPIFLKSLNDEDALKLVAFWIKNLTNSQSNNLYHPFDENEIRQVAKYQPTPRDLWQWCAANWRPPIIDPRVLFERIYEESQTKEYFELMNNDTSIVNTLLFSFEQIIGETVENVLIERIIQQPIKNTKFQFKIEGLEDNHKIFIGVGVCQADHARTVNAMLTRLMNYSQHNLTRACLVRSEDKKIKPTAMAFKNMQELVSPPLNGKKVNLKYDEIKQLYDLEQVTKKVNFDAPNLVLELVREKILENQLIQEILSGFSFVKVVKALIIDVYDEPIGLINYYLENGSITGLFLEIERSRIFDYQIDLDSYSVVYRPHKFIAELPDEKMEILPQLEGQEIIALIDLILFSESFGGSVTILTDEPFSVKLYSLCTSLLNWRIMKAIVYPATMKLLPLVHIYFGAKRIKLNHFLMFSFMIILMPV